MKTIWKVIWIGSLAELIIFYFIFPLYLTLTVLCGKLFWFGVYKWVDNKQNTKGKK